MFKEILLPLDLADQGASEKAVAAAIEISKPSKARIHALTVVPGFGMSIVAQYFPADFEENANAAAKQKLDDFLGKNIPSDVPTQAIVAIGTVYEEILRVAGETGCDLIVIGSHRPDLKDFLLGPNAARVVRHASCSVLVVRD